MNCFLTSNASDIEVYKKIVSEVTDAITKAFIDDTAYSGPRSKRECRFSGPPFRPQSGLPPIRSLRAA